MTCTRCGWPLQHKFCPNCGAEVPKPEPAPDCARCPLKAQEQPEPLAPTPRPARSRLLTGLAVAGWATSLALVVVLGAHAAGMELRPPRLARQASTPLPTMTARPTLAATGGPSQAPSATAAPSATPTPQPSPTLAPTQAAPQPTPTALVHIVQPGEFLRAIADRYGVTTAEIARANGIQVTDVLRIDQRLVIPQQGTPQTPAAGQVHVVRSGENLHLIAQRYNVSLAALMAENGLSDPDVVRIGQELRIPAAAAPAPTAAPSPTPTATPAPTQTMAPTSGAPQTPPSQPTGAAYEYPAPGLLTPPDGTVIRGGDDVLLNWSSVGLLGDDTWYVVRIWTDDPALAAPPTGWTRTTAWRIPASHRPPTNAPSHRFYWSVTVTRARTGEAPLAVSPESGARWFDWY